MNKLGANVSLYALACEGANMGLIVIWLFVDSFQQRRNLIGTRRLAKEIAGDIRGNLISRHADGR
jgi:hypothetical protein